MNKGTKQLQWEEFCDTDMCGPTEVSHRGRSPHSVVGRGWFRLQEKLIPKGKCWLHIHTNMKKEKQFRKIQSSGNMQEHSASW